MRYLIALSLLIGCAKNQSTPNQSCIVNSTYQDQGTGVTYNQINAGCSGITYQPGTLVVGGKTISVQSVTACGLSQGYLYQSVIYNSGMTDSTSPTGFIQYPDNYMVFPTGETQCWYKITNGKIDSMASPPQF